MTSIVAYAEVIGDPIEHSKSPVIHGHWLEALGLAGEYRRCRVGHDELAGYLKDRRSDPAWRGCNVTMPLKLEALMLADERTDGAVQAGAANLLVPREGKLFAGNTDIGAVMAVIARLDEGRGTSSVTLLGSGGAARAVLVALKRMGMNRVAVHARNKDEARNLAIGFGLELPPQPLDAPVRTDGLINATPLGMNGQPPLDLDLAEMPSSGWVFDLVSAPDPTLLVSEARRRGLAASGGVAMLVEQASEAFSLLFGAEPPRDPASDAELFRRLA